MIISAAVVPGPPLLAPALGVGDPAVIEVRRACLDAVHAVLAAGPDLVAVVGTAATAAIWSPQATADLAAFGAAVEPPARVAPLSVGIGALLLDSAGFAGRRLLRTVTHESTMDECRTAAGEIADAGTRVGLLAVADGTTKRTLRAPGWFDERAEGYDAAVERAVRTGRLAELHDLDPGLAADLAATGWAALQVLAFAFPAPESTVHYVGAPFGVGYLAASLTSV